MGMINITIVNLAHYLHRVKDVHFCEQPIYMPYGNNEDKHINKHCCCFNHVLGLWRWLLKSNIINFDSYFQIIRRVSI